LVFIVFGFWAVAFSALVVNFAANNSFQWDRAGAQRFGPVFHLQSFTVQQSASLFAARLPEFTRSLPAKLFSDI